MDWVVIAGVILAITAAYFIGGRQAGARRDGGRKRAGGRAEPTKRGPKLRVVSSGAPGTNGASGGSVDEQGRPCPWKLRAKARDEFEARWRCGRCGADVSWPEAAPPDRCRRMRTP